MRLKKTRTRSNILYRDRLIFNFWSEARAICCCLAFFTLVLPPVAKGQFNFDLEPSYCIQENIPLSFTDEPFSNVEWDFCVEQFSDQMMVSQLSEITNGGRTLGIDFIKENQVWHAIVTSWSAHKLFRLTFGNGLKSAPTSISDLGNPGGLLNQPVSIGLVQRNNSTFALVQNWANSSLIRIQFNDGIAGSSQTANVVYSSFGSTSSKMEIVDTNSELKAVAINPNTTIDIIDFHNDINRVITSQDVLRTSSIAGMADTREIEIVKDNSNWYAFIASFSGAISRINFGSDFMTGIKNVQLNVVNNALGGSNSILNLEIVRNGGEYHMHVATFQGNLFKINLGTNITTNAAVSGAVQYGQAGGYTQGYALKFFRDQGEWYGYALNDLTRNLYRIASLTQCMSSVSYSFSENPIVDYSDDGTFNIELLSYNGNDDLTSITKNIVISNLQSPDVDFTSQNFCQNHDIIITPQNVSGNITGYSWDFGDMSPISTNSNPTHQYSSAGQYSITVEVMASNTCANRMTKSVEIYPEPIASFVNAAGLVCTNNEMIFGNTTTDNYDGNLSYQWFVDNDPVSTNRDLQYAFTSTGIKTIKLQTSIPGCSSEITQLTSEVQAGPVVDFSFLGNCMDEEIQFTTTISEPVSSQTWDFGDGNTSSDINPKNTFATAGEFSVSLTAISPNGCNNATIKTVPIRSRPVVDFSIDPPPLSCSGRRTQFTDLTPDPPDGTITSWQWNFDDPASDNASSSQNPGHIFADAGVYDVSLTATTEDGCSGVIQKPVTIEQSPVPVVDHSLACEGIPVSFTETGTDIQSHYWEIGTSYYEIANPTHTFSVPGSYPVKLVVRGNNNCESEWSEVLEVPVPLTPDFSIAKNCVGHDAVFTDVTAGKDGVMNSEWDFAGEATGIGPTVSHLFNTLGDKNITLMVTGESGCSYSIEKTVNIMQAPIAGFTADPETGAAPLEVRFTNTSTGATQYRWSFGDGTGVTSAEPSPDYIFQNVGEYVTELKALNDAGCESIVDTSIKVVTPLPDVDLKIITVSENPDGSMKVIVTVENKGNTVIKNLPVDLDISGAVTLREIIEGPIQPLSLYNLVLSYSIAQPGKLEFLCADALLENDLVPEGNRICTRLDEHVFLLPPYPNPVKDKLLIEWIAPEEQLVHIGLIDSFGKVILQTGSIPSIAGLNRRTCDVTGLQSGIYLLVFKAGPVSKSLRIFISAEN